MADTPTARENGTSPALADRRFGPALRRKVSVIIGVMVASVVTVGCASTAQSSTGASTGPSPSSNQHLTDVTIGKAVDTIGFTTVDVAQAKGYFAKEGVNAKEEILGGSSTAFAALRSGSVHFVTASSTALLNARAKGVPLEAVASLDYGVSLQLLVSDTWVKAHNLSASQPLSTVMKGMVGAKLGEISTTDLAYDHYLEQAAGVNPNKFTYIQLKTQAAALAALQHGAIDAFLLSPPSTYYAQSQGGAQIIATLHSVPALANMAYDILVVDSAWAKSHAALVKSVATAMAMADNVMKQDPQAVLDVEKQHYPTMSSQVLLSSLKYVTFTKDGQFSTQMWQDALMQAQKTGLNNTAGINVSQNAGVWTNQYIKASELSS